MDLTTTEAVKDYFLMRQVVGTNLTENADSKTPLLLVTSGTVISGWLIPMWKWLEGAFAQGNQEVGVYGKHAFELKEDAARARELIDKENGGEELEESDSEFLDAMVNPRFLGLCDAKFQGGIGAMYPTDKGVHLRVRLSSVDAWSPGLFGTPESEDDDS